MKTIKLILLAAFSCPTVLYADSHIDQLRERSSQNPAGFMSFLSGSIAAICQSHSAGFITERNSKIMINGYLNEIEKTLESNPQYKDGTSFVIRSFSEKVPSCSKILGSYK